VVVAKQSIRLPHLKIAPALLAMLEEPARIAANAQAFTEVVPEKVEQVLSSDSTTPVGVKPVDVIIAIKVDPSYPQDGVVGSKEKLKQQLQQKFPDLVISESEFFLQCNAPPDQIQTISQFPNVDMVWPNRSLQAHLLTSVETVRASAGWRTFDARGKGITWAVMDTGINPRHPQFAAFENVDANLSKSFVAGGNPLVDKNGHGTHVAGIIAGVAPMLPAGQSYTASPDLHQNMNAVSLKLDGAPAGMAPAARLISVQVLNENGGGNAFDCIRGLEYLRSLNQGNRDRYVDGANISFGYDLEAETYGCGFSPICEEVNRAVAAGICVVVSCGNSGYGLAQTEAGGGSVETHVGLALSISDPANAEDCIAVGSVHKREPHLYGVSYFSSKGPTMDGRRKPDLVAPGERIISCNAAYDPSSPSPGDPYIEMSGTSMAAPHVSGAIAAFLSVRPDYRGNPREIKKIFKAAAMDLGRDPAYQGSGMVDAFRALTSV
jgi:serine protease AprX